VISAVRLQFLINVSHTTNPTWDQSDVVKWSDLEITVGVICACLPSIRLILARSMPKLFGSTHDRTQRSQYADNHAKISRNTIVGSESSSRRGNENKGIHCTTTFELDRHDKDEDEIELVHIG
jgi:hypothetical protein